jgi:hypothetical protein
MSDPATRLGIATDDGEPRRMFETRLESVGLCGPEIPLALYPAARVSDDLDNSPIRGGGGNKRGGGRLESASGGSRELEFISRSLIGIEDAKGDTPGSRNRPSVSPDIIATQNHSIEINSVRYCNNFHQNF